MTQRGSFVFALPFPVVRGEAISTKDDAFNALLDEWYQARWRMSERIEVWQEAFRECDEWIAPDDAEHHFLELSAIYEEHVMPVQKQWSHIFSHVAGRGSTFLCRGEFVPTWFVPKHALYAMKTHRADLPSPLPAHSGRTRFPVIQSNDPAWVYESVCMKYLQYACLQVLAFLRGVDNDVDEAMRYSNLAVANNAELVDYTLRFYFTSPGQRSSFLLSRNYHETFLAAHLQAQNDQIMAIKCTNSEVIPNSLYGALLLLRACKLLADTSSTFYDDLANNYKMVIAHSRCCAHFLLATAFWLAYKQDVAITLADSPTPLFIAAQQTSIDNRYLAMNAFYCIRSALLQTPVVPAAMSNFYTEVAADLASNYCIGTPPHPSTSGALHVSENDSIVIHGRIADDVAHTQVQIMHAQTPYIDIGQQKRFAVSMRAMEVVE